MASTELAAASGSCGVREWVGENGRPQSAAGRWGVDSRLQGWLTYLQVESSTESKLITQALVLAHLPSEEGQAGTAA